MDHRQRVQREFAAQAEAFAASLSLRQKESINHILSASGVQADDVVLDACCGPGLLSVAVAPIVGRLVALDLTERMLDLARQRCRDAHACNVEFACGDIDSIPYPDGHFDASFCRLALHHLEDPIRAVAELRRVTRRRGMVVLADIVTSENKVEAGLHNALETLRDPSHVRAMPISELHGIVRQLDLQVVSDRVWRTRRDFKDWIAITNSPGRADLVLGVMRAYCETGRTAGIELSFHGSESTFVHTWCMLAVRSS